jgi:hypothetical protein
MFGFLTAATSSGGGANSSTSSDRHFTGGASGITFGAYNAPAAGTPPWMLLALAALALLVIFKVVK